MNRSTTSLRASRSKSLLLLSAVALLLNLVLSGCGSSGNSAGAAGECVDAHSVDVGLASPLKVGCGKLKIAAFMAATNNAFIQANIKALKDKAAEAGASLTIFDGNWDPTTQFNQVQTAITSGKYNAFIVQMNDGNQACKITSQAAPAKGILVSVLNQALCGQGQENGDELWTPGTVHFTTTTATRQGFTDWIMQIAKDNPGPQNVAVLTGPDLNTNTANTDAAIEAVKAKYPEFKFLAVQRTDYTTQSGQEVALPMLQAQRDLDILITNYSDVTQGALAAAKQLGRLGDFKVYDDGGNKWAMQAVEDGQITGTLKMVPYQEGVAAIQALIDAWGGKQVDKTSILTNLLVTKDNIDTVKAEY